MNIIESFKAARRVSVPLIGIKTPDPAATIAAIVASYPDTPPPFCQWDCARGLLSLNEAGKKALAQATGDDPTNDPVAACNVAMKLPGMTEDNARGSIVFMLNAHRFTSDVQVMQSIWNLRDSFKRDRRALVLLMPQGVMPVELQNDVLMLDEPLPTTEELGEIVQRTHKAAYGDAKLAADLRANAVDATLGLAAFPAEQVIAMSMRKEGLDVAALWERKRQTIEETPGLRVWKGEEKLDDLGGLENLKGFFRRYFNGKKRPRVIVYIDEIEKQLGGMNSDSSGATQDQVGNVLSFMQNNRCTGTLLLGPAGVGKSQITKSAGNDAGIVTIELDFGAMKNSLVGGSEERIRTALKVIKAMGGDRIFFVATCNSIAILPPELRRRFKAGTFFVDLPNKEERAAIWKGYLAKHSLKKQDMPNDNGWTGAEIEQCCEYAAIFGTTLKEAANYIVPVSVSAAEVISNLRKQADGRFLSASKPGLFEVPSDNGGKPGVPRLIGDAD